VHILVTFLHPENFKIEFLHFRSCSTKHYSYFGELFKS